MDNEQQVSTELTRTKEVFLRESPGMSSGPPKLYSVEEEFEKTKRNRSKVVPIVVLAFVVIFGLASTAVTLVIQRSTRQVPIDIDEFNDINLTEILDRQKKNENAFQAAQRQLGVLISEMESRIDAITSEANGAVEIVQNDNISDNLKTSRTNLIRSDEARDWPEYFFCYCLSLNLHLIKLHELKIIGGSFQFFLDRFGADNRNFVNSR